MALIESGIWDIVAVVDGFPDEFLHIGYQKDEMKVEMFRTVDYWLGQLTSRMEENDSMMVVSDHGFGDVSRVLYMKEWLISRKYVPPETLARSSTPGLRLEAGIHELVRRMPAIEKISDYIRYRLTKIENQTDDKLSEERQNYLVSLPVPGSIVMTLGTQNLVWIRFLQKLGPRGGLLEGEIVNDLEELKSMGLIKNVYKSQELYHGKHSSEAPGQLLVEPYDDCMIDKNRIAHGQIYKNLQTKRGRHRPEGLFISYGHFLPKIGPVVSIYDILPTLLTLLRLPIPDSLDGRPFPVDK